MPRKQSSTLIYLPSVAYRGSIAAGDQGKEELETFCGALNSTEHPELRESLRRLIGRWQASGPNLGKMMYEDPSLLERVRLSCRAGWTPTYDGRAILILMPDYVQGMERKHKKGEDGIWRPTAEAQALVLFHFFTLNTHCEKLAGPCARCGNYYVKKRSSQKVYCSRRCGNASTAVARTRERLKTQHEDKIRRAKAVIREWNALKIRSTLDWKEWLHARKSDITAKFVTRAVNRGELKSPTKGRKP